MSFSKICSYLEVSISEDTQEKVDENEINSDKEDNEEEWSQTEKQT